MINNSTLGEDENARDRGLDHMNAALCGLLCEFAAILRAPALELLEQRGPDIRRDHLWVTQNKQRRQELGHFCDIIVLVFVL